MSEARAQNFTLMKNQPCLLFARYIPLKQKDPQQSRRS